MVDFSSTSDTGFTTASLPPHYFPRLATDNIELGSVLSEGGSNRVYRGTLRGAPVAVKKITAPYILADDVEKIVHNELKLLIRLRHSNFVCQILGYYQADLTLCIVMTLEENGDLRKYLKAGHLVGNWAAKTRICSDIATAINSIHAENIAHTDLKASSILLDRSLSPKVSAKWISAT